MADKSREIMDGLLDMLKNGDAHIVGIGILEDCGDCPEDCDERCIKEDKERFKKLVDGLCCALLHDNDSALCIFQQWRADKCRLENSYEREHAGKISEDEAKELREGCRGGLVSLERAFKNALFGEFFDLLDPMPLVNADFNEVIRARFLKNWQMIEDES